MPGFEIVMKRDSPVPLLLENRPNLVHSAWQNFRAGTLNEAGSSRSAETDDESTETMIRSFIELQVLC